ncbi:hypothetical protein NDN13_07160 [Acinetobacter sp. C32I]|uniref:hypothetical protein n=1 Tax=Acinetobacter sp. C32I TaxID=2950074 RepID=UPI002036BBF8|nr:hypothetical protein [Acinetobacter sp. C32I]USA54954.1 hypothetical protein NDN13_07160 [Acinetobacter sp. C32I]
MALLFFLLFLVSITATFVLLIKPSLSAIHGKSPLSRGKISLYGIALSLFSVAMIGVFAPPVEEGTKKSTEKSLENTSAPKVEKVQPKVEKTQAEIDQEAEDNKPPFELTDDAKQNAANAQAHYKKLADEDRPHFNWPKVDYTKAVAKVDLRNDRAILKAVGKTVADQEEVTNQNGEPMQSYYFSKDLANYLQVDLSREYVDVSWAFDAKDPAKATGVFDDGQQITRALLGGQAGSALYENIAKGGKVDELHLEDGTVIKNARCGQSMCRYQVAR